MAFSRCRPRTSSQTSYCKSNTERRRRCSNVGGALWFAFSLMLRCTAIGATNVPDFSGGGAYVEASETLVTGSLLVEGDVDVVLVADIALPARQAIAKIAGVQLNAVILTGLLSSGLAGQRRLVNITYQALPPVNGASICAGLITMSAAGGAYGGISPEFLGVLAVEMQRHEPTTGIWVKADWTFQATQPSTPVVLVKRPPTMQEEVDSSSSRPVAPSSATQSLQSPDDPNICKSRTSPCDCAQRSQCEWSTNDEGVSSCGLAEPSSRRGVSCEDCDLQAHCVASCASIQSSCECASSILVCRWDDASGICVQQGGGETTCRACPSQSHCNMPKVIDIQPPSGRQLELPAHLQLRVAFDRPMVLSRSGHVSFQCVGESLPITVPTNDVKIEGDVLVVSVESIVNRGDSIAGELQCDLLIKAGSVVDYAGMPYMGLTYGQHIFRVTDQLSPKVVELQPRNGQNGVSPEEELLVTLTFSESVVLNPDRLTEATLTTLEKRGIPLTPPITTATIPLKTPRATIFRKDLRLDLTGFVESETLYSLLLPAGCVQDSAANPFAGLTLRNYVFRTAISTVRSTPRQESRESSALNKLIMLFILIAFLLGLLVCAGFAWRLLRLHYAHGQHLSKVGVGMSGGRPSFGEPGSTQPAKGRAQRGSEHESAFATLLKLKRAKTWATQQRQQHSVGMADDPEMARVKSTASAASVPLRVTAQVSSNSKGAGGAADPTSSRWAMPNTRTSQASRASNAGDAPASTASPTASAGQSRIPVRTSFGPRRSASQPARAGARSQPSAGGQSPAAAGRSNSEGPKPAMQEPVADKEDPELKKKKQEVEKKLRANMDASAADRKKVLRELMLEYHPDKTDDPLAKDVFQFINASRGWFLKET
eukprot:TRINITY_DN57093_c0_g1_i1.p1 TRINITY_DN57093_c0_g1~~TRINITY_DN57093_c0_g1_i1.p1  ORF type:complete len:883 (-),score=104.12 TRINITY_DN57093_c0_g1_i1:134-2782(-)